MEDNAAEGEHANGDESDPERENHETLQKLFERPFGRDLVWQLN
jgi:hypothetical protein